MFFKKKVYPIIPTSESDTMTFIQKLDYLEYKLNELNERVITAEADITALESSVGEKSTVTATAEDGTLTSLTVDGNTYIIPQGSSTGNTGTGVIGGYIVFKWTLIDNVLTMVLTMSSAQVDFDQNGRVAIRFTDLSDLDDKTLKTSLSYISGAEVHILDIELEIVSDGLGNMKVNYTNLDGPSTLSSDILSELKGRPLTFYNTNVL